MKRRIALCLLAGLSLGAAACPDQTIGTKIDDALDNRPAEKLQDKFEDAKDAVKDATN